ncbi:PIG-L family deacetylase [Fulvivirga lutea]|uniref:PIG-L family deacetylase n=1 Tax=Fulvivirga lutea TaxID=2810512 RepID=A0A975A084_9BACT|nr:PIG-L family deacetylase [Fulvivirga lutea]QSE96536.1 PIG-L family deacetylase [Fulvivirga lutea]
MLRKALVLVITFLTLSPSFSQKPHNDNSAEILLKLKKLNFLGTVLYVAAHPDDENTRLIAYMSKEKLARTAYLSLTRGDGGQNLVGPEIREGLGIIRTQELLAARRIDGGEQFFTRANDFGYSKSTEETQKTWNREQILEDVVWVYRNFKPDVIITRFPPDERAGHGHHTTSAIFAAEAFDMAANKDKYPEHLEFTETWQPKRLYMNTGPWWNPNIDENTPGVITIDIGGYNSLLGTSYSELAALSRSQHKSQGFGSTGSRGSRLEFLEHEKGEKAEKDIFEGIDTSWGRVEGGKKIEKMINDVIQNYQPSTPEASVAPLLRVRDEITLLSNEHWKRVKIKEIDEIVKSMLGLYLEAKADDYAVAPGSKIKIGVEAVNRTTMPVKLERVSFDHLKDTLMDKSLGDNELLEFESSVTIPVDWKYSQPYWLREKGTLGTYKVDNLALRGKPENPATMDVTFAVDVAGHKLLYTTPLIYKWNDPVDGEQYRPFEIIPKVMASIPESVYIFNGDASKSITVNVKSGADNVEGQLKLDLPEDWKVKPESAAINLTNKGDEAPFTFEVTPPKGEVVTEMKAVVTIGDQVYDQSLQTIEYDHIPTQIYLPTASAKAVKMNIAKYGSTVGYIQGAGDAVPASLREIGYEVTEIAENDITPLSIENYDAIILGIRALNTNERADYYMPILLEYVENGGTLIIQYNTSHRLKTDKIAPYDLELSRDRVAEEDAPVEILKPKHPVVNTPNKITKSDFDNWVQERGLYFPNEWSSEFEAILSSHDEGEDAKEGGLLVAKYGKGHYVYSGYSWFRELPAGVPGAYKLFANLVSLGNNPSDKPSKTQ